MQRLESRGFIRETSLQFTRSTYSSSLPRFVTVKRMSAEGSLYPVETSSMATRLVASEHAGEMICPWPICRTTLGPFATGTADACLSAAAALAAATVAFGSFAACATWFATAACALLFVVLCDSAVGAVVVEVVV